MDDPRRFCDAFKTWANAAMSPLDSDDQETREWRTRVRRALGTHRARNRKELLVTEAYIWARKTANSSVSSPQRSMEWYHRAALQALRRWAIMSMQHRLAARRLTVLIQRLPLSTFPKTSTTSATP